MRKSLIKYVICALLIFSFSIFFVHKNILQEMEKIDLEEALMNLDIGEFTAQESFVKINKSKYRVKKGVIAVSETYEEGSEKILIPYVKFLSTSASQYDPIFYLGGGPGQSNMTYTPNPKYFENRDYVLIGFRGVDGNIKLDSQEISKAIKGVNNNLFSNESFENLIIATRVFQNRLDSEQIDLNNYTILNVIKDLETARIIFGYTKINLRSSSYGTRVALLYKQIHPEVIHRSLMESFNPPGGFIWNPEIIENQLQQFSIKIYGDDNPLKLHSMINMSLQSIPNRWGFTKLDIGKIKIMTFVGLFDHQMAKGIIDAYEKADRGDYSGLALLSISYDFMIPKMFAWGDLASKAMSVDYDETIDYFAHFDHGSYALGSPFSKLLMIMTTGLDINRIDLSEYVDRKVDIQTLIISGEIDVSTPKENVIQYLDTFTNATHIIINNSGHMNKYRGQQENITQLFISFYNNGEIDENLVSEIDRESSLPLIFNFSLLAKLLYLIGFTTILVILVVISYIVIKLQFFHLLSKFFISILNI